MIKYIGLQDKEVRCVEAWTREIQGEGFQVHQANANTPRDLPGRTQRSLHSEVGIRILVNIISHLFI